MAKKKTVDSFPGLKFFPLKQANWPDLEELFGLRGASGGCWCMWWRLRRSEYERKKGAGNRRAFHKIVSSGAPRVFSRISTAKQWDGAPLRLARITLSSNDREF
jgi:hypothetical protein